MENDARGTVGRFSDRIPHATSPNDMDRGQSQEQESRISGDYQENRTIAHRAEIAYQDYGIGMGRRERRSDRNSDNAQDESTVEERHERGSIAVHQQIRLEHERLFDTLQRAGGRTRKKDRTATTTDRAIDRSQSSVERAEQLITGTDRKITERERTTRDHQLQAEHFVESSRETSRTLSRHTDMER